MLLYVASTCVIFYFFISLFDLPLFFSRSSCSQTISRTKHVGLKGVNFEVGENDPTYRKWMGVYLPDEPLDYGAGTAVVPVIDSLVYHGDEM